jgi:hypothetical protein
MNLIFSKAWFKARREAKAKKLEAERKARHEAIHYWAHSRPSSIPYSGHTQPRVETRVEYRDRDSGSDVVTPFLVGMAVNHMLSSSASAATKERDDYRPTIPPLVEPDADITPQPNSVPFREPTPTPEPDRYTVSPSQSYEREADEPRPGQDTSYSETVSDNSGGSDGGSSDGGSTD